ncbi:MAG: hypothetical protein HFJ21_04315 [Clostridia bacterium]|jgi:hypothetical protein|nr:hypothetical protein [Clostridia bacterium]MCI9459669.1 hypothetical protein [Clostridia bacterium]
MGKKKKSVMGYVLMGVVFVALVLVVVGMFVGQVIATGKILSESSSESIKLFDDAWGIKEVLGKKVGVSNVFAIISFIVTLVGLAVLILDGIFRIFLNKDLRIIRMLGVAVTLVGAILILVAGLVMVSQCSEGLSLDLGDVAQFKYSAGAGVWLGFIGGLVGAVGGALPLLKKFN